MPRHLLDIRDLSTQELDDLMDRADAVSYTHLTLPTT